ncbi:hypothetical protein BsWGS_27358 [Bradybaena similaris]
MASRIGSSRRKADVPANIRIQLKAKSSKGNDSDDVEEIDDDDSDDGDENLPVIFGNGVSEGVRDKESAKETPLKKKLPSRIDTSVLGNVCCSACGRQVNPYKNGAVQKHSELKVVICKHCSKFLSSGEISKDQDGADEQCRWCGEGGRLLVCDECSSAFCKSCVMRNFSRSEFNHINDLDRWLCYLCNQKPLQSLQDNYRKIRDTLKALQEKQKAKSAALSASPASTASLHSKRNAESKQTPQNTVSSGRVENVISNSVSVAGDASSSTTLLSSDDLKVGHQNVDATIDKLTTATNTLREVLHALRSQSLSSVSGSQNTEMRRKQQARALNKSLETFLKSLKTILTEPEFTDDDGDVQVACTKNMPLAKSTPVSLGPKSHTSSRSTVTSGGSLKKSDAKHGSNENSESKKSNESNASSDNIVDITDILPSEVPNSKTRSRTHSVTNINGDITKRRSSLISSSESSKDSVIKTASSKSSSGSSKNKTKDDDEIDSDGNAAGKRNTRQNSEKSHSKDKNKVSDTNEASQNDFRKEKNASEKTVSENGDASEAEIDSDASVNSPEKEQTPATSKTCIIPDDENMAAKFDLIKEITDEIARDNGGLDQENEDNEDNNEDDDLPMMFEGHSTSKADAETETVNRKKAHASSSDEDTTKAVKKPKKSNSLGVKRSVSESNDKKDKEDKKKNENSEVDDSSSDPLSSADEDTAPRTRRHAREATGKEKEKKKTTEKKTSEKNTKATSSKQPTAKTKKSENDEKPSEVDEIDKEIAKLSKLPTRRKRKASDTDEDDPKEKESTRKKVEEKPVKRAKPGPKSSKKGIDYDDLSSDEHEKKDDDDDVEEDEDELPVSFFGKDEETDEQQVTEETDEQQPLDENEIAKKGLLEDTESENDDNEEAEGDSTSGEESDKESTKKTKKGKNAKKEPEKSEDEKNKDTTGSEKGEDSDENIGKRKKTHSKLLDAKLSDSDSDLGSKKKKKVADADYSSGSGKSSGSSSSDSNKSDEDSSNDSEDDEEDSDTKSKKKGKKKGKKNKKGKGKKNGSDEESSEEDGKKNKKGKGKTRRRIKKMSNSSDDGDSEGGNQDDGDDDPNNSKAGKRKQIRKVMSNKRLDESTRAAAKAEEKRRKRIEAKQREFNIETITDENNPMNCPITTKLVLEASKEEGNEPIIEVNKDLVRKLKPHQVEAVQFMWDCLYESVKRAKKGDGAGCILAHCMGLGKTLSVIAFVHTILTHEKLLKHRTCLIVSPLNTVLNWKNEWSMWFEEEDQLEVWELAGCKQNALRAKALRDWQESGGIMIIGYEMYRNLTKGARCKNKKQKATFQETLVNPGPDLVICDEGHILKNEASAISKAMNLMKTKRRVVLTGTPLQNNLTEYHCMLSFVKPNLLGTRKEFTNRFIAPILNGQCADSTQADVKLMKARAHVLHEMLAGCVQRRDYSSLTKFLPPKQEYVISVRLTNIQIELYEKYLELTGQGVDGIYTNKGARLFRDYQNLMKIWTHPWVLKLAEIRDELKARYDDEESFIDDSSDDEKEMSFSSSSSSSDKKSWSDSGEEGTSSKRKGKQGTRRTRAKARRDAGEDSDPEEVIAEWKSKSRKEVMEVEEQDKTVTRDWWAPYVSEDDQLKLELSNKLFLLFEILRMCEEIGDKVLIFSQSILSLNIIESFLEVIDAKFQKECENLTEEEREKQGLFGRSWTKNLDYYRMDGSTSAQQRQAWASSFNDMENYRTRLFLISTRAGGLGINLVAANRVIIFDASWNPSHDVQSIFRVYRFGQIKPCYIYRFLAQGTMEEKIYERQVTKLSLSQRVVDEHQIERHFSANDLKELYNFRPDRWDDGTEKPTLSLPKDPLLAEILTTSKQCVVSFHEHDSLLENQVEQTLTEEEKKAAWEEYENEKKGIVVKGPGMDGRTSSWPMMAAAQLLSREQIAATVEALRQQLPPDVSENLFQLHLQQALRKQVQIKQEELKRMELLRLQELNYLMMNQPGGMSGGMSRNQLMQNMTPWMQQMRAMQQSAMFMGGGGSSSGFSGMNQSAAGINRPNKSAKNPISNKPEDAIDLDDN